MSEADTLNAQFAAFGIPDARFEQRANKLYGLVRGRNKRRLRRLVPAEASTARKLEMLKAFAERVKEHPEQYEQYFPKLGEPKPTGGEPTSRTTFKELGELWTSGALYKAYGSVNGLRPLASDENNSWVLGKHVYKAKPRGENGPAFGDLPVAEITAKDVKSVMGAMPRDLSSQSRLHVYTYLRRLFSLAEQPCEIRPEGSMPVSKYLRPQRDPEKLYNYLYPSEVLALLGCTEIPLGRRILYVIAAYWGARKGSLYALNWGGVDFKHGMISMLKLKGKRPLADDDVEEADEEPEVGGTPVYFAAEHRSVLAVLAAWKRLCKRSGADDPVVVDVGMERGHDERVRLQSDLKLAGVDRAILFSEAKNVVAIRFHDLRATFITWARRAGKSDAWIAERSGHTSGKMISRYARMAQTLADLGYEPFPDVTHAIPELAPEPATSGEPPTGTGTYERESGPARASSDAENAAGDASSSQIGPDLKLVRLPVPPPSRGAATTLPLHHEESRDSEAETQTHKPASKGPRKVLVAGSGGSDDEDSALDQAVLLAAQDKQWDIVRQLGRELEARRLARSENVVPISSKRGGS